MLIEYHPGCPVPPAPETPRIRGLFLAAYAMLQDAMLLEKHFPVTVTAVAVRGWNTPQGDFGWKEFYWPELAETRETVLAGLAAALASRYDFLAIDGAPGWRDYPDDLRSKLAAAAPVILATGWNDDDFGAAFPAWREERAMTAASGAFAARIGHAGPGLTVIRLTRNFNTRYGDWFLGQGTTPGELEADLAEVFTLLTGKCPEIDLAPAGDTWRLTGDNPVWRIADGRDGRIVAAGSGAGTLRWNHFPGGEYWWHVRGGSGGEIRRRVAVERGGGCRIVPAVTVVEPGGELRLAVTAPSVAQLRWQWRDGWDRLLAEGSAPAADSLILSVPDSSRSAWTSLRMEFDDAFGPIAIRETTVWIPAARLRHDLSFLHWYPDDSAAWKRYGYLDALRRETGADAICNCDRGAAAAEQAGRARLATVPYVSFLHKLALDDGLFDPAWRKRMCEQARASVANHRGIALGYTLGDECYLDAFTREGRFTRRPEVWAKFRLYLREVYGSLEALNREWERAFREWDEIVFDDEAELPADFANPAPWHDFRVFLAREFRALFQELRQEIRRLSPGAAVGWDGNENFSSYDGMDYEFHARDVEIAVLYAGSSFGAKSGPGNVIFNSALMNAFRSESALSGAFMNGIHSGSGAEFAAWTLLFQGCNSLWQWHASRPDPECGALDWRWRPTARMTALTAVRREMDEGAATLLAHSRRAVSPVAIFYSGNNYHASTVESGVGNHINNMGMARVEFWHADRLVGRTIAADDGLRRMFDHEPQGHYVAAFKNFYTLCSDLGFQPGIVSGDMAVAGGLRNSSVKLLILPFVCALSDAEAAAIREFVAAGGCVLADYRCGVRDEHGKMRASGALDDLFGFRRRSPAAVRLAGYAEVEYAFAAGGRYDCCFGDDIEVPGGGCVLSAYDDGTPMPNSGCAVYGNRPDGAPALIVNHTGKGRSIYLNFDCYSYVHDRRKHGHAHWLELFALLFWKEAQTAEPGTPKTRWGNLIGTAACYRRQDGDNLYIGIVPDYSIRPDYEQQARLAMPPERHVYDLRRHALLGQGDIEFAYCPGRPELFAALSFRLLGWHWENLTLIADVADGRMAGPLAVRLRLIAPDGSAPEVYEENRYVERGRLEYRLPLALDDAPGRWRIEARCPLTGTVATAEVRHPGIGENSPAAQ